MILVDILIKILKIRILPGSGWPKIPGSDIGIYFLIGKIGDGLRNIPEIKALK